MKYDNESVRRQDRLLDEETARALLKNGEYGVLSMVTENGGAYGIPINYVWDGAEAVYFHCAPEGRKLREIERHPKVSFCVAGHTHVLSNKFTTEYESIVLQGTAHINLSEDERKHALELFLQKYSPNDLTVGRKYAEKSFHRTNVIRLDAETMSGKCKKVSHIAD